MRTTLSLDDDVAAEIERLRRERQLSYKELVNEALRLGLRQVTAPPRRRARFQTAAVDLGAVRVGTLDDVAEAIALAEGEPFR